MRHSDDVEWEKWRQWGPRHDWEHDIPPNASDPRYLVNSLIRDAPRSPQYESLRETFLLLEFKGRPFAVTEYGLCGYAEWVEVYLLIDLETGVFIRPAGQLPRTTGPAAFGKEAMALEAFNHPELVPEEDPIRRYLTTRSNKLAIATTDQLERYCAIEILRSDQPHLFPRAEVDYGTLFEVRPELRDGVRKHDADSLPYFILFGDNAVPINSIGRGLGRKAKAGK